MTAWRQGIHSDCSVLLWAALIHSNALQPYWLWIKGLRYQVLKEDTIASSVAISRHIFYTQENVRLFFEKAQWLTVEMLPRYSDVIQHKAGPLYAMIRPVKPGGLPVGARQSQML